MALKRGNLTEAAGKAIATSKTEATIVPITKLPGGNTVSSAIDHRTGKPVFNVVVSPPNGAKVMGGSDWPAFNEVLLETVLRTIPTNNPDAVPNRIAGRRPTCVPLGVQKIEHWRSIA
jgi:hypothetical protein